MESKISGYVEEIPCPVCNGVGCTVCNFEGTIQVGNREAPKIFIDAPEFEKDKIMTQLGKLKDHIDPQSRKEYSMAFTFYRELQELSQIIESEMFSKRLQEIIDQLFEYRLDKVKPVELTLNLLDKLKQLIEKMTDRNKLMAIHFEAAIDQMTKKYKEMDKKTYEYQQENKRLKSLLTDKISHRVSAEPIEAGFETVEAENE